MRLESKDEEGLVFGGSEVGNHFIGCCSIWPATRSRCGLLTFPAGPGQHVFGDCLTSSALFWRARGRWFCEHYCIVYRSVSMQLHLHGELDSCVPFLLCHHALLEGGGEKETATCGLISSLGEGSLGSGVKGIVTTCFHSERREHVGYS